MLDAAEYQLAFDLQSAHKIGCALGETVPHFTRALRLLTTADRKKVYDCVYDYFASLDEKKVSKRDFVRGVLRFRTGDDEKEKDDSSDYSARFIVAGKDPEGLAVVLRETVLGDSYDSRTHEERFREFMTNALGKAVSTPEQAAAIVSCVSENEKRIEAFGGDAEVLLADVHLRDVQSQLKQTRRRLQKIYEWDYDWSDDHHTLKDYQEILGIYETIVKQSRKLENSLPSLLSECATAIEHQTSIFQPEQLRDEFGLERTETGLFIPVKNRVILAESLQQVIAAAERDRSTLLNMSPRRFEEFMAALFRRLGFEVELTLSSRDGGADLICLKDLHGIPFRLAVEVKRYKETRPITVQLIRSFVGANEQFQANRLLYITTSRYTKPAQDFATQYASHYLSLKAYNDIQEWCRYCLSDRPKIIGAYANMLP